MSFVRKPFSKATAVLLLLGFGIIGLLTACNQQGSNSATSSKNVRVLTGANFQTEVLEAKEPVLVDFWAVWCGPCKAIAPIVSQLADEFKGRAKVGKVDVDAETTLAKQYNISAIPTLLVFKDGKVVEQIVGLRGKDELRTLLAKHAGEDSARSTSPAH